MRLQNRIYVMRHGQSENNVLGIESCRFETQTQFGLTTEGRAQVEQSCHGVPNFDFIYSSPFRRAVETAQIVAENQAVELNIEAGLHEFQLTSDLDQQSYADAERIIQDPQNDINHTPFGDGESFDLMYERMKQALLGIDQRHQDATILLVSHGSPVEALIQIMKNVNTGFGAFEDLPQNAKLVHLNALNLIA